MRRRQETEEGVELVLGIPRHDGVGDDPAAHRRRARSRRSRDRRRSACARRRWRLPNRVPTARRHAPRLPSIPAMVGNARINSHKQAQHGVADGGLSSKVSRRCCSAKCRMPWLHTATLKPTYSDRSVEDRGTDKTRGQRNGGRADAYESQTATWHILAIAGLTQPSPPLRRRRSHCASRNRAASKPAASSCIAPPMTAAMPKRDAGRRARSASTTSMRRTNIRPTRVTLSVLFNPGGGHAARVYDTTPDGREGWLTLFPRAGFAVYGVDRVNTGRVRRRHLRDQRGEARQRYPPHRCRRSTAIRRSRPGSTFRWGPKYGTFYPDTQFPKEALDDLLRAAHQHLSRSGGDAEIRRRTGRR